MVDINTEFINNCIESWVTTAVVGVGSAGDIENVYRAIASQYAWAAIQKLIKDKREITPDSLESCMNYHVIMAAFRKAF